MLRRILPAALALAAACTDAQPCPRPLEECGGQCVDVQSNPAHCGSCGVACGAGAACVAGSCAAEFEGPCHSRTGGAFVTLGFAACDETAKVWVTSAGFVDEAATFAGSTVPAPTPRFTVAQGSDCDGQWTWHVQAGTPVFLTSVAVSCADVCPGDIQADVPGFVAGGAGWCPAGADVVAVDRRP